MGHHMAVFMLVFVGVLMLLFLVFTFLQKPFHHMNENEWMDLEEKQDGQEKWL
mgnify:CR=1 FL=1